MCERDIVERLESIRMMVNYGNGDVRDEPDPLVEEARAEILRLRAELATARRDGWIAGRDAAAEHICGYCVRQNSVCADHIRNMEPPA